jgi:hypothetical protein
MRLSHLNDAIPQWWVRKYSNPIPQAMSHKPLGSTPVTASSSGGIADGAVTSDKLADNIAIDGTLAGGGRHHDAEWQFKH